MKQKPSFFYEKKKIRGKQDMIKFVIQIGKYKYSKSIPTDQSEFYEKNLDGLIQMLKVKEESSVAISDKFSLYEKQKTIVDFASNSVAEYIYDNVRAHFGDDVMAATTIDMELDGNVTINILDTVGMRMNLSSSVLDSQHTLTVLGEDGNPLAAVFYTTSTLTEKLAHLISDMLKSINTIAELYYEWVYLRNHSDKFFVEFAVQDSAADSVRSSLNLFIRSQPKNGDYRFFRLNNISGQQRMLSLERTSAKTFQVALHCGKRTTFNKQLGLTYRKFTENLSENIDEIVKLYSLLK